MSELFETGNENGSGVSKGGASSSFGSPRLRYALRDQVEMREAALDDFLPEDHPARIVWAYVCGLDLTALTDPIGSVKGHAGRAAADPRILMALWIYATLRGIGSARELDRLCTSEIAFQWICGGVTMNHHTLADFRTDHLHVLENLLTQSVATLMHQNLVEIERVAQDGLRVRASAGASSFRRRSTLEECLKVAQEQVAALASELQADPAAGSRRREAAKKRAAQDKAHRLQRALEELEILKSKRAAKKKESTRSSTTDPQARVIKMPDGGFRPAYNVQLATDTETQVIVGVDVTNAGGDKGQMAPMVHQIIERYGKAPKEMLVDGGFAKKEDITHVSSPTIGTTVFAPVMACQDPERDIHVARREDSPAVAEWRQRMATSQAKEIYKHRASTAECVNAIARNRGLYYVRVRGLQKVKAVILWYALAHNLMRAAKLSSSKEKKTP